MYDPRFDPDRIAKIHAAWLDYMDAEEDGRVWPPYGFMLGLTVQEADEQEQHFRRTRLLPWIRQTVPDVTIEEIDELYRDADDPHWESKVN
jgi:hypothetical protein